MMKQMILTLMVALMSVMASTPVMVYVEILLLCVSIVVLTAASKEKKE